jgi:hypothetical protein
MSGERRVQLEGGEELFVNFDYLNGACPDPHRGFLEKDAKVAAIDQLNRRSPVAGRLSFGFRCEDAGRYEQALLTPTRHGPSEVTYLTGADRILVPLTLKEDRETDERWSIDADAVESAVSGSPEYLDILEPGFAQQTLSEALKRIGR